MLHTCSIAIGNVIVSKVVATHAYPERNEGTPI